jgi:hypothetical protein
MPRKSNLLNIRKHLEHGQLIVDSLKKYGLCPAIEQALAEFSLINRTLLRKHDEQRAKGQRKDIRIGA